MDIPAMNAKWQKRVLVAALVVLGGWSVIDRMTAVGAADAKVVAPYAAGSIVMGSIHLDDPGSAASDPTLISATEAVRLAAAAAGGLADAAKPHSVQLAVVTNDDYGPTDERGVVVQKLIDHRLCWVVRFTGTEQPVYGGLGPDGVPMAADAVAATELNVVIDARSGDLVEMFSFQ